MRNISNRLAEKIKTHISCSITTSPPPKFPYKKKYKNCDIYEIMCKSMEEAGRSQRAIQWGECRLHAG